MTESKSKASDAKAAEGEGVREGEPNPQAPRYQPGEVVKDSELGDGYCLVVDLDDDGVSVAPLAVVVHAWEELDRREAAGKAAARH